MKIGVDGSALGRPRTGVGNYIEALLTPLVAGHPDVRFILYANVPIDFAAFANLELRISRWPSQGPIWQNCHLPLLLRNDNLDVFWGGNGFLPAIGSRKFATVTTIHDLVYLFAGKTIPVVSRLGRRIFQPISAKVSDKIVAVSESTSRDIERVYGRQVDAVINPIVSERYRPTEKSECARVHQLYELKEPYFLALGTLEPRKNLTSLISAYVTCRESSLRLPQLVIAGRKGWRDGVLTRRIRQAEQRGYIRTLGFVDDCNLPGLYAGAEAFILPSLYEGFGMPLLEAQLCGTPVLYSKHPAMKEAAGDIGVQFDPTIDGIAEVLRRYALGDCPLICRVPQFISNSARKSAAAMWSLILAAAEEHNKK